MSSLSYFLASKSSYALSIMSFYVISIEISLTGYFTCDLSGLSSLLVTDL